ncbi:hypothetical protein F5884DRAFT_743582 [Xylogone sp. PMI_703]|nr:hypothetical protein F5884DRAFT_743582 [Xylogone sp. PMI_703]
MALQLTDLPESIISLIVSHLAELPEVLNNVRLVNQVFYRAAAPFLYRHAKIEISSRRKLKEWIKELEVKLFHRDFPFYVRSLKISGRMPELSEDKDEDYDPTHSQPPSPYDDDDDDDAEYHAEFGEVFARDLPDGSPEEVAEAWAPLVSWIRKCTHLADLIWVCNNQLPPSILDVIQQQHSTCRIHLRTFRLRSLADPVTDPHELNLIQSPCLHSISVKTVNKDSDGNPDYNGNAIFQVTALAPKLRHLNVVVCRAASSAALVSSRRNNRPAEPWKGFVPPLEITTKGLLTSLSYPGKRGISVKDIEEWDKYVDMAKIHYLILGDVSDPLVFRSIGQKIHFTSLTRLDFGLSPTTVQMADSLASEAKAFIRLLQPLREFRFTGYLTSPILDSILERHGATLLRLTLNPEGSAGRNVYIKSPIPKIRPEEIEEIETHCPFLEYLNICFSDLTPAESKTGLLSFRPKINRLRQLEVNINSADDGEILTGDLAEEVWNGIEEEKGGPRLNCLHLKWFEVSTAFLKVFLT